MNDVNRLRVRTACTQERPGGPGPGARGVEDLTREGGKYRETRVEKKHKDIRL